MEEGRHYLINAFLRGQQQMTGEDMFVKETKEEAFYTVIPNPQGKRCVDCINFEQVQGTIDMAGTCKLVTGIIKRDASCDNWIFPLKTRRRQGYYPEPDK